MTGDTTDVDVDVEAAAAAVIRGYLDGVTPPGGTLFSYLRRVADPDVMNGQLDAVVKKARAARHEQEAANRRMVGSLRELIGASGRMTWEWARLLGVSTFALRDVLEGMEEPDPETWQMINDLFGRLNAKPQLSWDDLFPTTVK